MKRAIVTGAGGFIGGALANALLDEGCEVYGVDVRAEGMRALEARAGFLPLTVDLGSERLSERIDAPVDALFYLSWGGTLQGRDLYDVGLQMRNAMIAAGACEDAAKYCKRFLFISSSYEFMKDRERTTVPVNIYGIAKGAAARLCASIALRGGMEFNKLILTNTYGVGDRSEKAVNTIIRRMLAGEELTLVAGDNPNDWVYIEDTVRGLIAAAERGEAFRDYYIGHREITTFQEKIGEMRDLLRPEMELHFGGMPERTWVDYSELDLDALYRDTGFACEVDFREGILKTAAWLKTLQAEPARISGGGELNNLLIFPAGRERAVAA